MKKYAIRCVLAFVFAAAVCVPAFVRAENSGALRVHSEAMNSDIPAKVFLPKSYFKDESARWPVVYLLHGYGGNFETWGKIRPDMEDLAERYGAIIVCPDGATSWYWDCPERPNFKYETHITKELIPAIDSKYRTIASREGRAISGLSMGGHGALWLAFRHPDLFGACGSQSGGVDIRPFPDKWEMKRNLGELSKNPSRWEEHAVINQLWRVKPNSLYITIECGTDDFFYEINEELHRKLLYMNIPHDYATRPGKHNSEYWKNSVEYQLLGFKRFFDSAKNPKASNKN